MEINPRGIVVAVPEGLPLAVTLSLAIAMRRLAKDKNQVKILEASETMGSATTICTDKTGTLTLNRMTVVRLHLAGVSFQPVASVPYLGTTVLSSTLGGSPALALCCEAVALATESTSTVSVSNTATDSVFTYNGNATECALLRLAWELNAPVDKIRAAFPPSSGSSLDWGVYVFPFSSSRKRMSCVVRHPTKPKGFRLYTKGAPSYIFDTCAFVLRPDGTGVEFSTSERISADQVVESYGSQSMRCLALAFRDFDEEPAEGWGAMSAEGRDAPALAECHCTLIGIVGIEDPLRPTVVDAIATCNRAGVDVRMCTGDALDTAVAIARQCAILRPDDLEDDESGQKRYPLEIIWHNAKWFFGVQVRSAADVVWSGSIQ